MSNHLNTKSIFMRRTECPICSCSKLNYIYEINYDEEYFKDFINLEPTYQQNFKHDYNLGYFHGQVFKVAKCSYCSFIFQVNVLNDIGLKKLYEKWIDPQVSLNMHKKSILSKLLWYSQQLNIVLKYFSGTSNLNVLDWGGGFGEFCTVAKNYGMNVSALEFSEVKRSYLEKLGIATISARELQLNFYHFINLNQVLEHVIKPIELLKDIYNVLQDDGILYIGVPNCKGIDKLLRSNILSKKTFDCLSPHQHINAFTSKTLRRACRRVGFKVIFVINAQPVLFVGSRNFGPSFKYMLKNVARPLYNYMSSTNIFLSKLK